MKLTREVDIFQCPPSTKYCFMPLDMVKLEKITLSIITIAIFSAGS